MSVVSRQWLGWRYPSIRHLHQDLIAEATAQLAEYLITRPAGLPPSWFKTVDPPDQDVHRFHGLVKTVLSRRVQDYFRADFRRWADVIPLHEVDEAGLAAPGDDMAGDAGGKLDKRRLAIALLQMLAHMPEADRILMEGVALGGTGQPLDVAERKRVSRLRQRLLSELSEKLGQSSQELLGKT